MTLNSKAIILCLLLCQLFKHMQGLSSKEEGDCSYICKASGGCRVFYRGPLRAGTTSGFCFPSSYGGQCRGVPKECKPCRDVLSCSQPQGQREIQDIEGIGTENKGRPVPLIEERLQQNTNRIEDTKENFGKAENAKLINGD